MKQLFLILAIIGFILPSIFVVIESVESANYLLYAKPADTITSMFANRISSIFAIDLLYAVIVFFIWSYFDAKKHDIKNTYLVWILTMLFGLAGGFPLYLYYREKAILSPAK